MANIQYDNVTFFIGLPRSRTAWLARFLETGEAVCFHDPLKNCASIEELAEDYIDAIVEVSPTIPVFIADTSAAFFFHKIYERFPNARYLVVDRPLHEVEASLRAAQLKPENNIAQVSPMMLQICRDRASKATNKLIGSNDYQRIVSYRDLSDPQTLRNIWRFAGNLSPLSDEHIQQMIATNITVPWEDQRRNTDYEKVKRLFATIGFMI